MARKEQIITVDDRGEKLQFKLVEMGALKADRWKMRAIHLLISSNIDIPAGLAMDEATKYLVENKASLFQGLSGIDVDKALALADEMLFSCTFIHKEGVDTALTPELVDALISDSAIIMKLRGELISLHFGFLFEEAKLSTKDKQPTDQNKAGQVKAMPTIKI